MERERRGSMTERLQTPEPGLEHAQKPEEFLKVIDFDTINEIYDTLLRKSGEFSPEKGHINQQAITIDVSPQEGSPDGVEPCVAHRESRTITMYWEAVQAAHGGDPKIPVGIMALQMLLHEITHLRSRETQWKESPYVQNRRTQKHVGYGLADYIRHRNSKVHQVTAESFNEAVTEEISLEVLAEYLRRKGLGGFLKDEDIQSIASRGYTGDRIILHTVIDEVAKQLKVGRDQAWRGFVQEYFNGNTSALDLVKMILETMEENAEFAMMLYEAPHRDPNAVVGRIENPVPVQQAIRRTLERFSSEFLYDTLGLK